MDPLSCVIIADHEPARVQSVSEVLQNRYRNLAITAVSHDDMLRKQILDLQRGIIALMVLAEDLPPPSPLNKRIEFLLDPHFSGVTVSNLVVLASQKPAQFDDRSGRLHFVEVSGPPTHEDASVNEAAFVGEIGKSLRLADDLPELDFPPEPDPILNEQIRSLHSKGDRAKAYSYLQRIIQAFWDCRRARVERMTQGFSGDRVLRIDPDPVSGLAKSFVVKIVAQSNRARIKNEIDNWPTIEADFDKHGLKHHVPPLHRARPGKACADSPYLVNVGPYVAVAYVLLGEPIGRFINLQQAYVPSRNRFRKLYAKKGPDPAGALSTRLWQQYETSVSHDPQRCPAEFLIDLLLQHLDEVWYRHARIDRRELWKWEGMVDPDDQANPSFPPYGFTDWWVAHLLSSLEQLEEYQAEDGAEDGAEERQLLPGWDTDKRRVAGWIKARPGPGNPFEQTWPVALSKAHGDLNKTNVLFWVEEAQPFFIDFLTYQQQGHALQDLAHLESEVKFLLMDRDADSGLKGLDHTPEQLAIWCKAEHAFVSWQAPLSWDGASGHIQGVQRASRLINRVRTEAQKIHEQLKDKPAGQCPFKLEYSVALLYHTLRVIGYDGVSPFKRLLAVFSAARLIESVTKLAQDPRDK